MNLTPLAARKSAFVFALLLSLAADFARATVYQVGPTRTYTTLQSVANRLAPGDVVEVDGDATYPGGVTFDKDGTAGNPITIRGLRVNGNRPIVSGGSFVMRIGGD